MGKDLLGNHIEKISIKASDLENFSDLEVLGVSNKFGITKTSHVKSKDLSNYLYIEDNFFAYNPYRINVGSIGLTPKGVRGLVSPAYIVFRTKETLKAELLYDFLKSYDGLRQINKLARGTVRKALRYNDLCRIKIDVPDIKKQDKILKLKENTKQYSDSLKKEIYTQQTLLKKLRQSILQEAIEGKLTKEWREQNPDAKSASVLLEKIKAEKERLVKEKKIRKQKPLPPISEEEVPFEIPESWEWCYLSDYSINRDGDRIPVSQAERDRREKIYDYYGASGVIDKIDGFTHNGTFLLIGEDGANLTARSTPVAFIASGKFWVNNHAHILEFLDLNSLMYIEKYINAIDLKPYITGGFQPKLSQANLNKIFVALPPLKEQKEIVQKIEKLFAICDELEAQIENSKVNSEMLMQAVLKEAFEEK